MNTEKAPGYRLRHGNVNLFITRCGAQLAPAEFTLPSGKTVQPYYVAPWGYNPQDPTPVLRAMRGDFFCMPFGGNGAAVAGEKHPGHGEPAGSDWTLTEQTADSLALELHTAVRPGVVRRKIQLRDGDSALYIENQAQGFSGAMPLGCHPIIAMPEPDEPMWLASSPFEVGLTRPGVFSDPANYEYQRLAAGEPFTSLDALPLERRNGAFGDYSTYPSAVGYADLFCLLKKPEAGPAWMAAVYPRRGYLWFSVKNPAQLPATAVWVSNSGRYGKPWNGTVRCIGVEDVCAAFDLGLKESLEPNPITRAGFPTAVKLDGGVTVRYIQGVAELPAGFGRVAGAEFHDDKIVFFDAAGHRAAAAVRPNWIREA